MKSNLRSYFSVLIIVLVAVSATLFATSSLGQESSTASGQEADSNTPTAVPSSAAVPDNVPAGKPDTTPGNSESISTATHPGGTINLAPIKLVNNEWGAPPDEKLTCGVYSDQGKKFGWYWNRQDPKLKPGSPGLLPIYPSIRIGGNHRQQSDLAHFPIKVKDIKSLEFQVDYDYTEDPSGTYNLAYDWFLLNTDKSSPEAVRKAEIMIWLHATICPPPEAYKGDFSDGHNTYALYAYTMSDGRLYYAFIMKGKPEFQSRHKVDVKKLTDNLNLDPGWYIPGIELGSEIVNGSGKIEISRFSVNMNGTVIEK
jgi:hypothetical protein